MQDFRQLIVWQKAYKVVLSVYRATPGFPQCEEIGLTSQVCRAAVSIVANIAEGCGRCSDAEFRRFLYIAMGSASELQCNLLLARDLGYLHEELWQPMEENLIEVKRMLSSLIGRLKSKRTSHHRR